MNQATITPLILTYNEERNIERVLARLDWATQIVVVDSFSTDGTLELLRRDRRITIRQRRFDSFAAQLNFGLSCIPTAWVLALDADFVCSERLPSELAALPADPVESGYLVPFRWCVGGHPLRATLYPARVVLYRRDRASYRDDGHQQRIEITGKVGRLLVPINHDDRKPLEAWFAAQRRYAASEVEKLTAGDGTRLDFADRLRRRKYFLPVITPLYCLFYKGLILDGLRGWHYTLQRTYAEVVVSLLLIEHDLGLDRRPVRDEAPPSRLE